MFQSVPWADGAHSLTTPADAWLGLGSVEERGVVSCCLCLGPMKPHYAKVVVTTVF